MAQATVKPVKELSWTDGADELWEMAWKNEVELSRIQELMEQHLPFAKQYNAAHPILHQACAQHARGGTLILWIAWNSPEWRPLFYDKEYCDKYGGAPITRLRKWRDEISFRHMREGDPDVTTLFQEIRQYKPQKSKPRTDKSPERK